MDIDEVQRGEASHNPVAATVSFYINGVKVNAAFAQKAGNTIDGVKQILANSFAMNMMMKENDTNVR